MTGAPRALLERERRFFEMLTAIQIAVANHQIRYSTTTTRPTNTMSAFASLMPGWTFSEKPPGPFGHRLLKPIIMQWARRPALLRTCRGLSSFSQTLWSLSRAQTGRTYFCVLGFDTPLDTTAKSRLDLRLFSIRSNPETERRFEVAPQFEEKRSG